MSLPAFDSSFLQHDDGIDDEIRLHRDLIDLDCTSNSDSDSFSPGVPAADTHVVLSFNLPAGPSSSLLPASNHHMSPPTALVLIPAPAPVPTDSRSRPNRLKTQAQANRAPPESSSAAIAVKFRQARAS